MLLGAVLRRGGPRDEDAIPCVVREALCASRCWFGMVFDIFGLMLLIVVVVAIVKLECLLQESLRSMWGWDAIGARVCLSSSLAGRQGLG